MLAGGMWLESIPDAARAYKGLITVDGLKSARKGARGRSAGVLYIGDSIYRTPALRQIRYRRAGQGLRPHRALALMEPAAARIWLEERLGPLAYFAEVGEEEAA